jgi:hypothetical protein
MDSNRFNSGFNTIADQFRNKGVASNKQRMAGDYLAEFTKDSGVQNVLGNKDYRDGVTNKKDSNNETTESKPSAVMSTLGAKPTPAPTPGTPVSKAKAAAPASPASSDDAYDFRAWAEDHMKNGKTSGQDVDYWEKAFRSNAAEAAKRQQAIAAYKGPKTGEEWAALDQQNFDNNPGIDAYTNKLKSSYAAYSGYHTNVQNNKQWEAASAKWKKK